jgi:hypothetical protein
MQNGKDTHESADASPLLRDTHKVIAAVPADDAVAAAKQITAALAAINGNSAPALQQRFDAVSLLDAAAVPRTDALLREYLNTPRHTRQRESELWQGAYHFWGELAAAYALCAQGTVDPGAAGRGNTYLQVAAARAIRALRRQLQWLRIRYAPAPPQIWESLAALLVLSEAADNAGEIAIYPGTNTTLQREILKMLALAVMTGENLMPPEQHLAAHLVKRYARDFSLSQSPGAGSTHSFDVKHPQAPAPLGAAVLPGADLRYFDAGAAVASLAEVLHALEQKQGVAAHLGFTIPIDPALLTPVLQHIYLDWAGKPLERLQQREKNNARISVLPGFSKIAHEIDRSMGDPFDFTAKAAGESWVASDISADGFGVVMPAVSGDWVSVGSVLGIENEVAGAWSVGIVRRVRRLDAGQMHIGVQVLCRHAQAVRVMREASGAGASLTQRIPVDRGILLTADAIHQQQIELLVSDAALYNGNTLHVVTGDGALLVKLHAIREVTADCARVSLTVLGIEK